MGSGYFHVGPKTSTHLYISLQLKGWNMENPAVRKKIPDLQRLIFNFQVPVFQCQGCKQWISQNLYYLAVSICLRTWVNWIVELPTISTAFLPGEFSSTPPALARAANESAHVTPQTKQQTRISLKFVGLRSEVWGLRSEVWWWWWWWWWWWRWWWWWWWWWWWCWWCWCWCHCDIPREAANTTLTCNKHG